jgi:hypothetical protein
MSDNVSRRLSANPSGSNADLCSSFIDYLNNTTKRLEGKINTSKKVLSMLRETLEFKEKQARGDVVDNDDEGREAGSASENDASHEASEVWETEGDLSDEVDEEGSYEEEKNEDETKEDGEVDYDSEAPTEHEDHSSAEGRIYTDIHNGMVQGSLGADPFIGNDQHSGNSFQMFYPVRNNGNPGHSIAGNYDDGQEEESGDEEGPAADDETPATINDRIHSTNRSQNNVIAAQYEVLNQLKMSQMSMNEPDNKPNTLQHYRTLITAEESNLNVLKACRDELSTSILELEVADGFTDAEEIIKKHIEVLLKKYGIKVEVEEVEEQTTTPAVQNTPMTFTLPIIGGKRGREGSAEEEEGGVKRGKYLDEEL